MELINAYNLYPVGLLSLGGMNFVPHIRDGFVRYKRFGTYQILKVC